MTEQILAQWRIWQEAQGLSERTVTERAATMRQLSKHAELALTNVTPFAIMTFCGRPELSPASKASYHASIRAFYAWAVKVRMMAEDPTQETPRPKRPKSQPRPIQSAHLDALLAHANRKRTRMMILLGAYAGLRVHEIAKFQGEDLDRISGIITVTGKGGKTAMIPAHARVLEEAKGFPREGHWFPAYTAQSNAPNIRPSAVSKAIKDTMKRAGFEGKAHQLRHWYGTTLLERGVDLRVVQELMRHESPATTAIYTHVSMKQRFAGIETLQMAA